MLPQKYAFGQAFSKRKTAKDIAENTDRSMGTFYFRICKEY
jgi:hypothetical protein